MLCGRREGIVRGTPSPEVVAWLGGWGLGGWGGGAGALAVEGGTCIHATHLLTNSRIL